MKRIVIECPNQISVAERLLPELSASRYSARSPDIVAQLMRAQVPMHCAGDIEEIPGVVSFLLSGDASCNTGVNIPISGGIR